MSAPINCCSLFVLVFDVLDFTIFLLALWRLRYSEFFVWDYSFET